MKFTTFLKGQRSEQFPTGDLAWKIINDYPFPNDKSDDEIIFHLKNTIAPELREDFSSLVESFRNFNSGYKYFNLNPKLLIYPNSFGEPLQSAVHIINHNVLQIEIENDVQIPLLIKLTHPNGLTTNVSYKYNLPNSFFIPDQYRNAGFTVVVESNVNNAPVKGKLILLTSTQEEIISTSDSFPIVR